MQLCFSDAKLSFACEDKVMRNRDL